VTNQNDLQLAPGATNPKLSRDPFDAPHGSYGEVRPAAKSMRLLVHLMGCEILILTHFTHLMRRGDRVIRI